MRGEGGLGAERFGTSLANKLRLAAWIHGETGIFRGFRMADKASVRTGSVIASEGGERSGQAGAMKRRSPTSRTVGEKRLSLKRRF